MNIFTFKSHSNRENIQQTEKVMKTWNNENGFPQTCISHFIVAKNVRPSFSCFILFEEKIKFHPKANTVSHLPGGEKKLSHVLLFFFLFHF